MANERASRSRADRRVAASQSGRSWPTRHGVPDDVLQLQRVAGNAAVARLVAAARRNGVGRRRLLRSVEVSGGKFTDDPYIAVKGASVGAQMALKFQPSAFKLKKLIPATEYDGRLEVHLVQIVREVLGAAPQAVAGPVVQGNVGFDERKMQGGPHAGWGVDVDWQAEGDEGFQKIASARQQSSAKTIADLEGKGQLSGAEQQQLDALKWQRDIDALKLNKNSGKWGKGKVTTSLDPRYAQQRISADVPLYTTEGTQSTGNAAVKPPGDKATFNPQVASLRDSPSVPVAEPLLGMEFEVAAMLEYGPPGARISRYIGSVRWGWKRSAGKNDVTLTPLGVVMADGVSDTFKAAAQHWNQLRVTDPGGLKQGPQAVLPLPVQ